MNNQMREFTRSSINKFVEFVRSFTYCTDNNQKKELTVSELLKQRREMTPDD
jgi:hypothetical protein